MSIASYSYNPKSFQGSNDIQDLSQQLKIYQDENVILKDSLQTMIKVNTQLIDSIQQYAKLYGEGYGMISQEELEQLSVKVEHLQKKIISEKNKNLLAMSNQFGKNKSHQLLYNVESTETNNNNMTQILNVIEQLSGNINNLQQQYSRQLSRLQQQLSHYRQQSWQIFSRMQLKFQQFNQLFKELINEIASKDQIINNLNSQFLITKNKKSQIRKQMKISLTIEDLKNTLERKIQEKQSIVKVYETMIQQLKKKLGEKI